MINRLRGKISNATSSSTEASVKANRVGGNLRLPMNVIAAQQQASFSVDQSSTVASTWTGVAKKNVTFDVADSCWDDLGTFGQIVKPDATTRFGRRVQMTQVIFFAILALASIMVQLYTDNDNTATRNSESVNIQV